MNVQEFNTFKKYIVKWRNKFGLTDWYLSVEMNDSNQDEYIIKDSNTCETVYDFQNRWAQVHIDKNLEGVTNKTLEATAIHEIIELSYADIREMLCKFYNRDIVDKWIHEQIRRVENALK